MSFENWLSVSAIVISILSLIISFVFSYENPVLLRLKNKSKIRIFKKELMCYYKNSKNYNYFIENSSIKMENSIDILNSQFIEFLNTLFISSEYYVMENAIYNSEKSIKEYVNESIKSIVNGNPNSMGYLLFLNNSKFIEILNSNENFKYNLFENIMINKNKEQYRNPYSQCIFSSDIKDNNISELFFEYRNGIDSNKYDILYFELLIAVTLLNTKDLNEIIYQILNKYKYNKLNSDDLVYFIDNNKLNDENIVKYIVKFQYFNLLNGIEHSTNLFEEIDNLKLPIDDFIDNYHAENFKENIKLIAVLGVLFCAKNRHNIDLKNPNNKIEFSISEEQYANFIKYYIDYKEGKHNNKKLKHFTDTVVKNIKKLNISDS